MTAWREKYGDVVRLGPNRVMISNKEMLRQILITDDFHKGPMYLRVRGMVQKKAVCCIIYILCVGNGPPSMISQIDKDAHKQLVSEQYSLLLKATG